MSSWRLLFVLVGCVMSGNVWAADLALPEGTIALRPIQGELVDPPGPITCPPGANCDPAALVEISFTLSCGNTLGPVSYTGTWAADGFLDVHLSAFELVNSRSATMRCVRAPIGRARLYFGFGHINKERVRLHWVNQVGSSNTI